MDPITISNKTTIVFARFPEQGFVKTRIAAIKGDDFALSLYEAMLGDLIEKLSMSSSLDCHFYIQPGSMTSLFAQKYCLDANHVHPQHASSDLGEKMFMAFMDRFADGSETALCVGSDIPALSVSHIEAAFDILSTRSSVLGPAADGGYYLIGFRNTDFYGQVFHEMCWSTETVLRQTISRLSDAGISFGVTETLMDLDDVFDIDYYLHFLSHNYLLSPRLSRFLQLYSGKDI